MRNYLRSQFYAQVIEHLKGERKRQKALMANTNYALMLIDTLHAVFHPNDWKLVFRPVGTHAWLKFVANEKLTLDSMINVIDKVSKLLGKEPEKQITPDRITACWYVMPNSDGNTDRCVYLDIIASNSEKCDLVEKRSKVEQVTYELTGYCAELMKRQHLKQHGKADES